MSERFPWAKIRERYEAGELTRDLAAEYGCTMRAIQIRARSGNWKRPAGWSPPRSRTVASDGRIGDPVSTPQTAGEILQRHQRDWQRLKPLHDQAIEVARIAQDEHALRFARLVRLLADGLRIIIQGEREAWAVGPNDQPPEIDDAALELEIQRASERIARQRRESGDGDIPTIH
jgi:hypothetical protein